MRSEKDAVNLKSTEAIVMRTGRRFDLISYMKQYLKLSYDVITAMVAPARAKKRELAVKVEHLP